MDAEDIEDGEDGEDGEVESELEKKKSKLMIESDDFQLVQPALCCDLS